MNLLYAQWLGLVLAGVASPIHAVEINLANQAELEMTQGIGPQMSDSILGERNRRPFESWADVISRISGIGPARAQRLSAAGLTVNGLSFDAPKTNNTGPNTSLPLQPMLAASRSLTPIDDKPH